jgi:hypothetical protein
MTHEHLNDEQLSAHLDGDSGEPTLDAQIAACDVCRNRLERLDAASALVRTPVTPVASSVRAAAIEAALDEGLPAADGESAPAAVTALPPRRRGTGSVLTGAAAAAVVVVAIVGASLGLSHTSTPSASPAASAQKSTKTLGLPEATPALPSFGAVASPPSLRHRVTGALRSEDALVAPQASSAESTFSNGTTQKSASASRGSASRVPTVAGASLACVMPALRSAGTGATLLLVATANYDHTPALVVVARTTQPSSSTTTHAIVVAKTGCRLLLRTTL